MVLTSLSSCMYDKTSLIDMIRKGIISVLSKKFKLIVGDLSSTNTNHSFKLKRTPSLKRASQSSPSADFKPKLTVRAFCNTVIIFFIINYWNG